MAKWSSRGPGGRFVNREAATRIFEAEDTFLSDFISSPVPAQKGRGSLLPGEDPSIPGPDPAWDYYWPTRSINPPRPRTLQARYSARLSKLEIMFRNHQSYHYEDVPPQAWHEFKRTESPGKYINAVLNSFPYGPGGWGTLEE